MAADMAAPEEPPHNKPGEKAERRRKKMNEGCEVEAEESNDDKEEED